MADFVAECSYESDGGESLDLFEDGGEEEELEFSEVFSLEGQNQPQAKASDMKSEQSTVESSLSSSAAQMGSAENSSTDATNCSCIAIKSSHDSVSPIKMKDAGPSSLSPSPPMSRIGLNAHKAGMEGLDKKKINQIILEASKGSKFYENEVKKEQQVTARINHLLEELEKITPAQKLSALKAADGEIQALETSRDLNHIIVHIDMDAFYAAVEMRDNPKLKDIPMAVGSNYMLSTSNYVARRYGVRAAMPGFIARKLCPDLVIVKTNFAKYRHVCGEVREILAEYDPEFCPMGLDESYLDLTDYVAARLRDDVHDGAGGTSDSCFAESHQHHSPEESTETKVDFAQVTSCQESTPGCSHRGETKNEPSRLSTIRCFTVPDSADVQIANYERGTDGNHSSNSNTNLTSALTTIGRHEQYSVSGMEEDVTMTNLVTSRLPAQFHNCTAGSEYHSSETGNSALHSSKASNQLMDSLCSSSWECAKAVVEEIRGRIFQKTGLTASAGIAPNKMLAKVASDMNKPNGQYFVTPTREAVLEFVQNLPIRKISGIGKVTERMLNALGITTCRDLYEQRATLLLLFSKVSSQFFLQICLGVGSSDIHQVYERKSMSTERTFSELSDPADLHRKCQELCQSLAEDMQKERVQGCTVTLKLKTVFFEVKSHAVTLPKPASSAEELYSAASELLRNEIEACSPSSLKLRLMGVRISSFQKGRRKGRQDTLEGFLQQPSSSHHEVTASSFELQTSNREVASQVIKGSTAVCPVCGCNVAADNLIFNRHIDECLNQSAIQEVTSRATKQPPSGSSKSTATSDLSPPSRKRKAPQKELAKKRRTLDYFWK